MAASSPPPDAEQGAQKTPAERIQELNTINEVASFTPPTNPLTAVSSAASPTNTPCRRPSRPSTHQCALSLAHVLG